MNIAYVLNLIGLAVKNILILRILLISGQIILIYTGYVRGNWIVMFWNTIFLIINLLRTIMLLIEMRPVKVPEELDDIYRENFIYMTEREFLRFWKTGEKKTVEDDYVIKAGETPDSVFIIVNGRAVVRNRAVTVAVIGRGGFIGEMSYVSDRPPSADVLADSELVLWCWKRSDMNRLKIREHSLWVKVQQALGHDLVTKVNKMSDKKNDKPGGLLARASRFTDSNRGSI